MKKVPLLFLMLLTVLMLSGCSALFSDTYYSEKEFQGNQSIDLDSDVQMVHNYAELRRLVFNMMNNHEESAAIRFAGYTGNVVSDISSVCNAIKTESAYGAYCVDYISYDLTQIVSYYEAAISISYKYTVEELHLLKNTSNHEGFSELLALELSEKSPKVIVKVNNGVSDHGTVTELIHQSIREHPLALSYYPEFSVRIFSGNTSQKIYEVNVMYDEQIDDEDRVDKMRAVIDKTTTSLVGKPEANRAFEAAQILSKQCAFDLLGGNTAYDALIEKTADSEGVASAFKAICDELEIECQIVNGKLDREEHFWNIVKIEDAYYHFDIAVLAERGAEQSLFVSDANQQINYWWDQSIYPNCVGGLTYSNVNS